MSRARILSVLLVVAALTAALGACGEGSGDDPQAIVEGSTLEGVDSGNIDLALDLDVQGGEGGDLDISLSGPFQSEEGAKLPELDLSLAVKGNMDGEAIDREGGVTLLGSTAYVGYEGTEYEVDPTTFSYVKSMLSQQSGGPTDVTACRDAASGIELNDVVENLTDEGNVDVGGTDTTKVSGDLDVAGALDAFEQLVDDPACSEQLESSGSLPSAAELEESRDTVEDSVKSTHVEIYVGDDDIIRRVVAEATIEPSQGSQGSTKRVDVNLDLTLTGVNEDQSISAPAKAKPLNALFLKLGINPLDLLYSFQNGGAGEGLGSLLEKLGGAGEKGSGRGSYYECLGEASTPVDIENCTGLLQ